MDTPYPAAASRGHSLIELLCVLALTALTAVAAMPGFGSLLAQARLDDGAIQLAAALRFAQSEALRSGRPVHLCGLAQRRNLRHNGCRNPASPAPWRDGVLVFADFGRLASDHYDRREDLRDVSFAPDIRVEAPHGHYRLTADGQVVPDAPLFVLRAPVADLCASVRQGRNGGQPVWCRGPACPGCR